MGSLTFTPAEDGHRVVHNRGDGPIVVRVFIGQWCCPVSTSCRSLAILVPPRSDGKMRCWVPPYVSRVECAGYSVSPVGCQLFGRPRIFVSPPFTRIPLAETGA